MANFDFTLIAIVMYVADVVYIWKGWAIAFTCLFMAAGVFWWFVQCVIEPNDFNEVPVLRNHWGKWLLMTLLLLNISIFLPERKIIYAFAAGYVANIVAKDLSDMPELQKVRAILNQKLDELIEPAPAKK